MANFITSDFNRCCEAAQVQCCITSDPHDYKTLYQFKCLGSYGVEITHGKATYILNPGDEFELKTNGEEPKFTQWFVYYDRAFNR